MKYTIKRCLTAILIMGLIMGSTLQTPLVRADEKSSQTNRKAMTAYQAKLKKIMEDDSKINGMGYFGIADINHDGISEMIVTLQWSVTLYTYYSGKVKKVQWCHPGHGAFQFYKKGSAYRVFVGYSAEQRFDICKLVKGKEKVIASQKDVFKDATTYSNYKIKGKKVTKQKYDQYVKKVQKNSKELTVKEHDITAANIKNFCK